MTKRLTMIAAAAALAAGIARAGGLEEAYAKAQSAAGVLKLQTCWERGEDEAADTVGLPTLICFRGSEGFDKTPRQVFSNSYREPACGEAIEASLEISAPNGADGGLKVEAVIETTPDYCHSRRRARVVAYAKR